jgi:hypothetical protein
MSSLLNYTSDNQNYYPNSTKSFVPSIKGLSSNTTINALKKGTWVYIILLIFEGALRKWVLPSLATPLLIIRDPVALWMIVLAVRQGIISSNFYLTSMIIVGITGTFTAVAFGHGNLWIALYGARIMLIHFPLMFVIGKVLDREDLLKIGKAILIISILMTGIIGLQFYSPQSAFLNRGIGGDVKGSGFDGALGYFRPSGTFSFTNGTTLFYGLQGVFVFYFLLNPKTVNSIILISATVALFAAIPLSISRGLFFQIGLTLVFTIAAIARKPKYLGRMLFGAVIVVLAFTMLSNKSFFQTSISAFSSRFDAASEAEGGLKGTLGGRYLGGIIDPILESFKQPFFGAGLGLGTNVGSMLSTGKQEFLISEGEWGRLTGELGPTLGLYVIFVRLAFCVKISLVSYRRLLNGDLLPWLLLSFGLITISQAQWAQPTSLGFSTVIAGLIIASLRNSSPTAQ